MEKALRMRVGGASYAEIAAEIGCSTKTAGKLVRSGLQRVAEANQGAAEELRALMSERIEVAVRAIWPFVERGNLQAIDRLVKLLDRAARLHALDLQPSEGATPATVVIVGDVPPPMPIRALPGGGFEVI